MRTRSDVARGGESVEIDASDVVVGDVVLLSAGSAVPGDGRLLEARDLFVNEAALTGESNNAFTQLLGQVTGAVAEGGAFAGQVVNSGVLQQVGSVISKIKGGEAGVTKVKQQLVQKVRASFMGLYGKVSGAGGGGAGVPGGV